MSDNDGQGKQFKCGGGGGGVGEGKQQKCGGGIHLHYSRLILLQINCLETKGGCRVDVGWVDEGSTQGR